MARQSALTESSPLLKPHLTNTSTQSSQSTPTTSSSTSSTAAENFPIEDTTPVPSNVILPHLGLWSGVALIIGRIVGAGIFASPGPVYVETKSIFGSLAIWILSGLISAAGAFCYAELGTAIPVSGGDFTYLFHVYGPLLGFFYTFIRGLLIFPLSAANVAGVFSRYFLQTFYYDSSIDPDQIPSPPDHLVKLFAAGTVAFVVALNLMGKTVGNRLMDVLGTVKVAALTLIVLLGAYWMITPHTGFFTTSTTTTPIISSTPITLQQQQPWYIAYPSATFLALYAYNGFSALNFAAGEMKNPQKTIPVAVTLSMTTIIILYTFVNAAYFVVLSEDVVGSSKVVAMQFGLKTLGPLGAPFFSCLTALSVFGTVSANIWLGSRVLYATSHESKGRLMPKFFGHVTRDEVPRNALLLVGVVGVVLAGSVDDFTVVTKVLQFEDWFFTSLVAIGLIILRYRSPNLPRPFKVWTPLAYLFAITSVILVLAPLVEVWEWISGNGGTGWTFLVAGGFGLLAVPVYYAQVWVWTKVDERERERVQREDEEKRSGVSASGVGGEGDE
ncbi:hypothetical protein HDU76_010332 [Blyttiomyces sp. JEL0837]|nr:hypothetical protein HDU76_010332 [Blyttiomyces sp. JEL0837]